MARFGSANPESKRKSGKRHAAAEQGGGQAAEKFPAEPEQKEQLVTNPSWQRAACASWDGRPARTWRGVSTQAKPSRCGSAENQERLGGEG
jgi:hypothetical protein